MNHVPDKLEVSTAVKTQQRFQKGVKEYRVQTIYMDRSCERERGVSWHQGETVVQWRVLMNERMMANNKRMTDYMFMSKEWGEGVSWQQVVMEV